MPRRDTGSSGFDPIPDKIVAPILGTPMIRHVWEAASRARRLSSLVVATDSPEIAACAEGFGARVALTGECASGTDRVAQVAVGFDADIIVNLQGDEPLLPAEAIDRLVDEMTKHPECGMATLAVKLPPGPGLDNPNVVKVVASRDGEALYFSRKPLSCEPAGTYLKHVGIYAFRRDVLMRFREWGPSPLEKTERLEQLRALENGVRIRLAFLDEDTVAVDEPGDILKVETILKAREQGRSAMPT